MVSKNFIVLGLLAVVFLNSSEVLSKNASGGRGVSSNNFTESVIIGGDTDLNEGSHTDSNEGFNGVSDTAGGNQGSNTDSNNNGGGLDTENNGVYPSFRRMMKDSYDTDHNGGSTRHFGKEGKN